MTINNRKNIEKNVVINWKKIIPQCWNRCKIK